MAQQYRDQGDVKFNPNKYRLHKQKSGQTSTQGVGPRPATTKNDKG